MRVIFFILKNCIWKGAGTLKKYCKKLIMIAGGTFKLGKKYKNKILKNIGGLLYSQPVPVYLKIFRLALWLFKLLTFYKRFRSRGPIMLISYLYKVLYTFSNVLDVDHFLHFKRDMCFFWKIMIFVPWFFNYGRYQNIENCDPLWEVSEWVVYHLYTKFCVSKNIRMCNI